jgi:hypothetical protein
VIQVIGLPSEVDSAATTNSTGGEGEVSESDGGDEREYLLLTENSQERHISRSDSK